MAWDSYNIKQDGQTDWLVRLYEKTINAIRELGLPTETKEVIVIDIPTLMQQAHVMRHRNAKVPKGSLPSGVIK